MHDQTGFVDEVQRALQRRKRERRKNLRLARRNLRSARKRKKKRKRAIEKNERVGVMLNHVIISNDVPNTVNPPIIVRHTGKKLLSTERPSIAKHHFMSYSSILHHAKPAPPKRVPTIIILEDEK